MGEYIRDSEEHQIYRDFVNRLGKVAAQYQLLKQHLSEDENFSATLTISLLHPLLTIYTEFRKRNSRYRFEEFDRPLLDIPHSYGLRLSMIKSFSCFDRFARTEDVTFHFVLEAIRDALSHPCPVLDEKHQRTGYETVVGQRGFIEKFRFIESPDIFGDSGRIKALRQDEAERILRNIAALNPNHGVTLQPVTSDNTSTSAKYQLINASGERLVRKMVVEIPLDALKTLVKGLSEYLGRPIEEMATQQFNSPRLVRARR